MGKLNESVAPISTAEGVGETCHEWFLGETAEELSKRCQLGGVSVPRSHRDAEDSNTKLELPTVPCALVLNPAPGPERWRAANTGGCF